MTHKPVTRDQLLDALGPRTVQMIQDAGFTIVDVDQVTWRTPLAERITNLEGRVKEIGNWIEGLETTSKELLDARRKRT